MWVLGGKFPWGLVIQEQPPINLLGSSSEACGGTGELIIDGDRGSGSMKYCRSFPSHCCVGCTGLSRRFLSVLKTMSLLSCSLPPSVPLKPANMALGIGNCKQTATNIHGLYLFAFKVSGVRMHDGGICVLFIFSCCLRAGKCCS